MTTYSGKISIIGGGSFGTAVAQQASLSGQPITLFCRDAEVCESINNKHINARYFPNSQLSHGVSATTDADVIASSSIVFVALPSGSIEPVFDTLSGKLNNLDHVILLSKGLCNGQGTFDKFFTEMYPHASVSSLKGPTFARQLLLGIASGMTLGTSNDAARSVVSELLAPSCIQLDFHSSATDVEHVSALKNIYAIALGALNAVDDSENLTFFGTTMILREMQAVLRHLNCDETLLWKYCGVGDLLMTSLSNQSRNRTLGYFLGKDFDLRLDSNPIVLEGVKSLRYFNIDNDKADFPIIELTSKLVGKQISANAFFDQFISQSSR